MQKREESGEIVGERRQTRICLVRSTDLIPRLIPCPISLYISRIVFFPSINLLSETLLRSSKAKFRRDNDSFFRWKLSGQVPSLLSPFLLPLISSCNCDRIYHLGCCYMSMSNTWNASFTFCITSQARNQIHICAYAFCCFSNVSYGALRCDWLFCLWFVWVSC